MTAAMQFSTPAERCVGTTVHTTPRLEAIVPYIVQAWNVSDALNDLMREDDLARRLNTGRRTVRASELYAYMTHVPVARWGIRWLERGAGQCRFLRPVHEEMLVRVAAVEAAGALCVSANSEGERCALGVATLPHARHAPPRTPDPAPILSLDERLHADAVTLAPGFRFSSHPIRLTWHSLEQYLFDIGETEPLYASEKVVHPAIMLRLCNLALTDNVKLGPLVNVASSMHHCALAYADDTLAAHAEVMAHYERDNEGLIDLDVIIVANEHRAVARVQHKVIYRLKQTA